MIRPTRPRVRRPARRALLAAAALAIAGGCQPHRQLDLVYRPGGGSGNIFEPSRIAVAPAGDSSKGQLFVGTIFDPDGNAVQLYVPNPPESVSRLVADDLDHKGLKAKVFPSAGQVPDGFDYIALCEPQELSVVKRIDADKGPGGNSFLMEAKARLQCVLGDRNGKVILSDSFSGNRNEPPLGEAAGRRPSVSDPGVALSAAIVDAIDAFTDHPDFRRVLPAKMTSSEVPAGEPSDGTSATPSGSTVAPGAGASQTATALPHATPSIGPAAPTPIPSPASR